MCVKFVFGLEMITQEEGEIPDREFARPCIPHDIPFPTGGWSVYRAMNYIQMYDTRENRWVKVEEI
jgi:kelch-like protein 10